MQAKIKPIQYQARGFSFCVDEPGYQGLTQIPVDYSIKLLIKNDGCALSVHEEKWNIHGKFLSTFSATIGTSFSRLINKVKVTK